MGQQKLALHNILAEEINNYLQIDFLKETSIETSD